MLIAQPDWVHRRIDALEYRDEHHLPAPPERALHGARGRPGDPGRPRPGSGSCPLTTLRKETLVNFNCRDESGTALPVLTRTPPGPAHRAGDDGLGRGAGGPRRRAARRGRGRREIATLPAPATARDGTGRRGTPASPAAAASGRRCAPTTFFSLVLDRLTDQFLLITLVDDVPGTQRIVKFSYEELGELAAEPWPRGPLAALGWIPRRAASPAESLFSAESYHFEADLPPGIDVPGGEPVGGGRRGRHGVHRRRSRRPPAHRPALPGLRAGRGRGALVGVARPAGAGCAPPGSPRCWAP